MDPQVLKQQSYPSTRYVAFVCGVSVWLGVTAGLLLDTWRRTRQHCKSAPVTKRRLGMSKVWQFACALVEVSNQPQLVKLLQAIKRCRQPVL